MSRLSVVGRSSLPFFLLLGLIVIHRPAMPADAIDGVSPASGSFDVMSRASGLGLVRSPVPGAWIVEAKSMVALVPLSRDTDGSFCLHVDYAPGRNEAEYRYIPGQGLFKPANARGGGGDCTTPLDGGPRLGFRVFAAASESMRGRLRDAARFRLVMRWPPGTREGQSVWLGDTSWTLEGEGRDRWELVAQVSPGSGGTSRGSGWIRDPRLPGLPALVLADDVPSEAVTASPMPRARTARLPAAGFAFSMVGHVDPEGVYLGAEVVSPPVIEWGAGESWQRLYLEVVDGLGDPSVGRYCVQAVYDRDGRRVGLFRGADGHYVVGGEPPPALDRCVPGETLAFPLVVQTGGALLQGEARFQIRQTSEAARFALADARVVLAADDDTLAEVSPTMGGAGATAAGGWFSSGGVPTLLLSDERGAGESQAPLSVFYSAVGDVPPDALRVNGRPWRDEVEAEFAGTLDATWDPVVAQAIRATLCADRDCARPIARLPIGRSSFALSREELLAAGEVTFQVEWGAPGAAPVPPEPDDVATPAVRLASAAAPSGREPDGPRAGEAPGAGEALVLEPSVVFGRYRKPLISCLARIVSDDFASEPFSLRLGRQTFDLATLPDTLGEDSVIDLVFDRFRGGGDCPVAGLRATPTTLERLRADAATGPVAIDLATDEPLFAGYLQLNAAPFASSLARWKNALEFFDRFHGTGRSAGRWADGVVYGAGERGDIVPVVAPEDNFVASLSDAGALRSVARTRLDETRVARLFFASQLDELAAELGDAPLELLVYDDLATDCESYPSDLAAASLDVRHAVVLAGIDGYTARDGPRRSLSGGIAHVCVESPTLRVYAFNWRERAANEDFELMLETILEDLDDNRHGVGN